VATTATREEVRLMNETIFEQLQNPGMIKQAIDTINDFTRTRMREDGFYRRIMPPVTIPNDELDRQVDTPKPCKIVDKEPDSPAAISIPFATLPVNVYIRGPRYRVAFDRIVTPRFTTDVDELRTWVMDIRQVLSDNAIKDMMAEEDSKFIGAVNLALIAPDTPLPWSGVPQWETIHGGISRETLLDAKKIMPSTDAHLEVDTILINNVTIIEVMKFGRDEMGGDFSQEVLRNGWSEREFLDARWIISIKRDLIPDDTIFMFSDPKFIGKSYLLEDTTMYIKREAYLLEFFAYATMGGTIGHTGGLARADFA
jgi:hypothetical protein